LLGALAVSAFLLRGEFRAGHSAYVAVGEDPAALYSLYPWDVLAARELRAGHFPLWNPYSGLGMPLLANLQSAVFVPWKWPFYLWPHLRVLDCMVVLRLALAGTFTFMLARRLGRSRTGAGLAGAAFALSGYTFKHLNMVSVSSEMWLPLCLYLIAHMKERASRGTMIASALVWWQVMVGGNPEAALYVSLIGFAFAVLPAGAERPARGRLMASFFIPFLLGALLAAVQTLPFIEYLG